MGAQDSKRIVIAGGHGKIAQILTELLTDRGDQVVGLIRNLDHTADIQALGAEPVLLDLEHADFEDVVEALQDADAVVFAAGAGPGSGVVRKDSVDRAAAVLLADAADAAGVTRFVQISAMGAGEPIPDSVDEVFAAYLVAKTAAEQDLVKRDELDWTIVRPGLLTDDAPTGLVSLTGPSTVRGNVTRADVAAVIAELLAAPAAVGKILTLLGGDMAVEDAVSALA
ncbi:SDR family oxidoreductase [Tomitella biformata]|uniref:SDR family oxidoreductase n=1 Tax=Tomitella biformata TaxID=630403 RepID=UPI000465E0C4|nr:SDR family oxidoreductase [Tomitella biformata]